MDIKVRVNAFIKLATVLKGFIEDQASNENLKQALHNAAQTNPWFIKEFELLAIKNILPWLDEKELADWASKYCCELSPANIGIVLAGNIPLVGFHDFLSTVICGHHAIIKMSGKDKHLLPAIIDILIEIEPAFKEKITVTAELPDSIDALIATGSNNTARYFEYFYKDIPKIIRKNRSSVAILTGNENDEDYQLLAKDICTYFGLGCRNVSKLYVPNLNTLNQLTENLKSYNWLLKNTYYASNLKFQRARLKTLEIPFVDAKSVLFMEAGALHSPVSIVNYELYNSLEDLEGSLQLLKENIQCKVGKSVNNGVSLGSTQQPELQDYADGVNTLQFLAKITVEP